MPIFSGAPLGLQSPTGVYRFPSGAQVVIHESQPLLLAICFISDFASHVIWPIDDAVSASRFSLVASRQAGTAKPASATSPARAGAREFREESRSIVVPGSKGATEKRSA